MGLMVSVLSLKPDLCQDPYEGLNEGLSGRNHTRQPTDVGSYHLELHLNVAEKGACQDTALSFRGLSCRHGQAGCGR